MIYRKGFWHILLRVILLTLFAIGLSFAIFQTTLWITPIMFGLLLLIAVIELNIHLQAQERNWIKFLQSVKYRDFNRVYQKQTSSKELAAAYELITQSMEELQANRQAEFRLLQTVLGHISVAVVCLKEDGEVVFTNKAFDELLGLPQLMHADRLKKVYPNIYHVMISREGISTEWIDHQDGQKLLVKTEHFKLKKIEHRLISLTDIRSSLDTKELESYQKLMRVMAHEIMNSATPILSLIRVVNHKLVQGTAIQELAQRDQQKMATSLRAIEERTAGILSFVDAYKQINNSIAPYKSQINTHELIETITTLMEPSQSVEITVNDQIKGEIFVDRALIGQVLINLLKNAIEAVLNQEHAHVAIEFKHQLNQTIIAVQDNGPGVPSKDSSQLFVPFYTTKENGSGIGLALSRNIIKAHGGTLEYSRTNSQTRFEISIPQQG